MIELDDLPELENAVMIAAFEGWNDAGEAAPRGLDPHAELGGAAPGAPCGPPGAQHVPVNRPRVVSEGGRRRISWRTTRILVATDTPIGRDVILVQGVEPSFRWRAFAIELMELAQAGDVTTVITLGALLADVAHTRPIQVTATSDNEDTRHRHDLEASTYEGPTGIVGVIADAAVQVGVSSISIWAAVPHYAHHTPSPKATRAIVSCLEDLLDGAIDHGGLDDDARAWEHGLDALASEDSEVAEYVESLEQAQDTAELPEASGDAIAKEFERYLRKRGTED